ncbi:MAG: hypothetical protein QM651_19025, partial [Rhodoblastus sp.]
MRRSVQFLILTTALLAAQADACLAQAIFTTAPPSLSRVIPYGSQPSPQPAPPQAAPVMERAAPAPVQAA